MAEEKKNLDGIIESILKPLRLASKDGFQRLNSVKSIEPFVSRLCDEAVPGLPEADASRLKEIKKTLSGFDSLAAAEKKERISKAMGLADSLTRTEDEAQAMPLQEVKRRLKLMSTPLQFIKGIGPRLAERLSKKGLSTVEDLLYFLPIRHEDRRKIKTIKELVPGQNGSVSASVMASGEARYGKRKVFEMAVTDGGSILKVKWFNYRISYMKNRYKPGQKLILFGTVSAFGPQKEMIHPDIELLDEGEDLSGPSGSGSIIPIYSQVENLHQKTFRKIISSVVEGYASFAVNGAPRAAFGRNGMLELSHAFKEAHLPSDDAGKVSLAKKSLAFDELFLLELGLALKREQAKKEGGVPMSAGGVLEEKLRKLLPFTLTGAQERTLAEVKADMGEPHPMNRLIQGDVGSGKTIVSLIAALTAVEAGYQAAIMAPTEILAEQHYLTTHRYSDQLGVSSILLTGNMVKSERAKALASIKDGGVDLIVGTHALIQKDVEFKRLGLAVIDEQHRFGVAQRAALKKKGALKGVSPDILIMTATPIPRTLSMTVFGDLDVSIIDELPPGRKPVSTRILRERDRMQAYDLIRGELKSGSQCYIVYPLVEGSDELPLKDATNMKEHLERDIFREFRVGLLHGRLKADEKEAVMHDFKNRRLDILVSTTVIEVGVDVPNATVMLIEHAERFGLAQLHQLRGRVGRGEKKSVCLLLAAWTNSEDTYKRLKVMEATQDGFKIAEEDLKIRGPGDFLGTRQAGLPDFKTQEALTDLVLLKKAREEALNFLERNPRLQSPQGEGVREVLKARWEGRLELAEIG
ncbi:MAG: ATP-dependent DNA helicase RecG [Deltaproteobacteria bacterium]|nr:ATP-dependent DNA helicase RecG [Deltaproteobacteria bacterium]